jgi:hypothetical protein
MTRNKGLIGTAEVVPLQVDRQAVSAKAAARGNIGLPLLAAEALRLCVVLSVFRDELLLVGGDLIHDEDGVGGANRNAGATIDAALGIHIKLGRRLKTLFIFLRVNAVGRTGFDAEFIFRTGIGNDVCHDCDLPFGFSRPMFRTWAVGPFAKSQCTKITTIEAVTPVTDLL